MNIIISHDVDHITAWEHKGDLILPKHIIRDCIELGMRYISYEEMFKRLREIRANKWNNLESLMKFDKENGLPATFFFGVENGLGLSYNLSDAKIWMNEAVKEGFAIGVHGIAYERLEDIRKEFDAFARTTKLTDFGIRMHYLRRNAETLHHLEKVGYGFDSSFPEMRSPYRIGNLWEFPLHIMDGHILCKNNRWQNQTFSQSKDATKVILENAVKQGIDYLTILLHDRYFSDSFKTWKDWYVWVIEFLKGNGFRFINYYEAIRELQKNNEVSSNQARTGQLKTSFAPRSIQDIF